jgi:hypothetical protein
MKTCFLNLILFPNDFFVSNRVPGTQVVLNGYLLDKYKTNDIVENIVIT